MGKLRKFIDKKKAVSFQLVHRSQQDPLIADEDAPQHVLVPIVDENRRKASSSVDQNSYLKDIGDNHVEWPQHVDQALRERKVRIQLPPSVFASKHEDKEGMLSKAAPISGPQLHLDPDLVAAMDEDFDFEDPDNELEDDFIDLADGVASDQEFDDEFEREDEFFDEIDDEVGSLNFDDEETKTKFTNYSMSSSIIRRNDNLTLLDDRFEKMFAGYDENEIGALDCDEIEGHVDESSDMLLQFANEFEQNKKREQLDKDVILNRVNPESDEDQDIEYVKVKEKEKWDCESILSTYSNIYNHPKLIKEPSSRIEISKKTGIPKNVLGGNKLTQRALDQLNENYESKFGGPKSIAAQSVISQLSVLSIRPKDEQPEQRHQRKKLLKEYKRERRIEKKLNTLAFKEEAKRQAKVEINNRKNVQGNKIL